MRQDRGADPASVAHDAVTSALARGSDVLLVDTAGRLHTKTPLMDELAKIRRVIEKAGGTVDETLLVLDAQTGQNGIAQARAFTDAVDGERRRPDEDRRVGAGRDRARRPRGARGAGALRRASGEGLARSAALRRGASFADRLLGG